MKGFFTILFVTSIFLFAGIPASLINPLAENLAARKWFDSARFGMFIHWGAFSVPGSGEWVMNERNITVYGIQPSANHF